MWQDAADFARPKWGIYRSLINSDDLQDEVVLFNNFGIEELEPLSVINIESLNDEVLLFPNPTKDFVTFKNIELEDYDHIRLYNSAGKYTQTYNQLKNNTLDVSNLEKGVYYINFIKFQKSVTTLKCIIE